MGIVNIDGLPAASTITGPELFECEQGGVNSKVTATQLLSAGGAGFPGIYTYQQLKQIFPAPNGNPTITTADVGDCWWNGTQWIPQGPFVPAQGGVPIVRPPSYTMNNNGAFVLNTALFTTLPNCYFSIDSGGLYTGSRPGIYFVQMSSTTAGTIYPAYQYAFGNPQIPSSPVASTFTGIGAFTPAVGTPIDIAVGNIPGTVMGLNGRLEMQYQWAYSSSANNKTVGCFLAGTTINGSDTVTTSATPVRTTFHSVTNQGSYASQSAVGGSGADVGTSAIGTAANINILSPAVDTSKTQRAVINMNIANAADWIVLVNFTMRVYPSGFGDVPPNPTLTPVSSLIVPPGAAAIGANTCQALALTTASSVSGWSTGTFNNNAGAALYAGNCFSSPAPPAQPFSTSLFSTQTVNGTSMLAMGFNTSMCSQTQNSTASSSGYFGANVAFYVQSWITLSMNHPDNWPAFYLLPQSHKPVSDNNTYGEIDIFEGGFNYNASNYPQIAAQGAINWQSGVNSGNYNSSASEATLGPALDFTHEHAFGVSYVPGTGILTFDIDGVPNFSVNTTSLGFSSVISPLSYYMIWDTASHGANVSYSMYVRGYSIWHP